MSSVEKFITFLLILFVVGGIIVSVIFSKNKGEEIKSFIPHFSMDSGKALHYVMGKPTLL